MMYEIRRNMKNLHKAQSDFECNMYTTKSYPHNSSDNRAKPVQPSHANKKCESTRQCHAPKSEKNSKAQRRHGTHVAAVLSAQLSGRFPCLLLTSFRSNVARLSLHANCGIIPTQHTSPLPIDKFHVLLLFLASVQSEEFRLSSRSSQIK